MILRGQRPPQSLADRGAERRSARIRSLAMVSSSKSLLGTPLPVHAETGCLYLDWNGTSPIFPEVTAAMEPWLVRHGNPSSSHSYGREAKQAVETVRRQVAALVNCDPEELCFTSCGTESNNWAITGTVMAVRRRLPAGSLPHVVTSAIEHPAVLQCLKYLADQGLATYTAVPVDEAGLVDPAAVRAAVRPETALVTIMHSNNEVGTIQPTADIAAAVASLPPRPHGPLLLHSDAAQSIGKVEVDVRALGVDALTIVGHKFGAPKGVGALYIRRGVSFDNYFFGGGQESGRRAGTENVLLLVGLGATAVVVRAERLQLLVGLGAAAEVVRAEQRQLTEHMQALRDRLQERLLAGLPKGQTCINGPSAASLRLPNTLSISVAGLSSSALLDALSDRLAASAAAACHPLHGGPAVSAVLEAMGQPLQYAGGTLRLSVGRHTTLQDVDRAAALILEQAAAQGVI